MIEAEVALKNWKSLYDELVKAEQELKALPSKDGEQARLLSAKIARLVRESDEALNQLTKGVALLNERRRGEAP